MNIYYKIGLSAEMEAWWLVLYTRTFLNQARTGLRPTRDWFLEIAFVRDVCMRVCMCVSAPEAINN